MSLMFDIKQCFNNNLVYYTRHAKFEMENDEYGHIFEHDIYKVICNGEIIEEYPDDKPYPSVLIYGKTKEGRPLHIVCSYNKEEDIAIIITVYQPNPDLWVDYTQRRKQ